MKLDYCSRFASEAGFQKWWLIKASACLSRLVQVCSVSGKGSWPHCELEVAGKGSSCCLEVVGYAQDTHMEGWKSKSGGVDAKVQ